MNIMLAENLFIGASLFIGAFIITSSSIFILKTYALKINFTDMPTKRKTHKIPTPLVGGIGMFIGFHTMYYIVEEIGYIKYFGIFISTSIILFVGLLDDWYKSKGKDMTALPKLILQVVAALIIYLSGIAFTGFKHPLTLEYVFLPSTIKLVVTILWILGVTTIINFSDGLDGLSGGLSAITTTVFFIVAIVKKESDAAIIAVILLGVIMGFLKYNKFPASVFAGDSGATFLGFLISVISLESAYKQVALLSLVVPIIALGVPFFDNIYVVFKRIRENRSVYIADSNQIHHRLVNKGLPPEHVVKYLYIVNLCFALSSIILFLTINFYSN
ncbi:MraY family glycosyltransferase [Alkaliphilus peptidifermentans]|uniref:UDP-N-acetylmuramyl pentapeptide phosphotransferase/UDP-N-acetylglucosamine-1-phosphate transferase n=1 Tax=Alkaliphilus peptidifermentans DSM 18978 TaxID=1120976 RepID=A0A1G5HNP5_9FIRM|nr:MraY family glycosyltransferase [Alkaliphilus peptidifermentans]SCY64658.1 UDP-N-acetylmuramyl pentapeptide phosphotransferase/UDP-N-acetylglucosamine-1-phosphate transferase [Alkaliphilus peptidifermentans DSM 18978]